MAAGFSKDRLARIAPFLAARYVEPGLIPGALTLIWRRGGVAHLSLTGSIDLARGTAMRQDAIFRIYSMTKPITSVALLMLLEEGKIALDDPVARYIPGFAGLGVFAGGSEGAFGTTLPERPMLVVDLLRHTSGLTYGFMNRTPVDAAYRKHGISDPNTEGGLPAMLAVLAQLPLEFSPGTAWNYSVSTDVVGALIEIVSGQRLGDFLRSRILVPLGMADTDFFVPDDKRGRFAACYAAKEGRLDLQDDSQKTMFGTPPKLESGGGGLVGTAGDYLRFCRMLLGKGELDGVRLLSPKTVALMTMNHLPGNKQMTQMMASTAMFNETGYSGVGFGLGASVTMDLAAARLPGSIGEFAWGGAAGTAFFVDPKEDMAVIFMTQVLSAPDRVRLRRDLRTLVYGAMTESFVIVECDIADWQGPFDAALRARALAGLEAGAVLFFPRLAFRLAPDETQFLDASVSDGKAKNISLDPATGKLQATSLAGARAETLAAMMERFGSSCAALVHDLLPYRNVERARTSFRPVQVEGRHYSRISDDRLLHIDAFPSRPMRGRRILRFFANIAPPTSPKGSRRWQVGQPFEDFARAFLPRVSAHWPGRSWLNEKLGVTRGRRSRYDELMLSLHDAAKRDAAFQTASPQTAVEFPPGSCWLVFTDQVLHAALGGEFALEQTFHLDVAEMAEPARAPVRVLERLSGRTLV